MMNLVYTRLNAEWQDFDISYPQWLTRIVLDEFYYVTTLVVMSLACFAMGMITGIIVTVV